jgi:Glycosyltransferase family 87
VNSKASLGLNEHTFGLVCVAIVLAGAVLWSSRGIHVEKTDFSLTYVGGYIVHEGDGGRLYDLELQKQVRNSLFRNPNPLFYEHPPFEALLLSPLAALPYRTAYMIWGFFNAAVWLLLIFFLRPYLQWPREEFGHLALWLLFAPLGVALFQGQSSLWILAMFSLALIRLQDDREFSAGLVLGFALVKLQFVLPFVLIMVFRRKWKFVGGFGSTSLFLGAVSLGVVGWKGAMNYIRFLLTIGNNPQNLSYGSAVDMPTIHGFLYAVLGNTLNRRNLNITVGVLSLLLLWFIARRWNSAASGFSNHMIFAAAIGACLLTSSHMFTHDFSPLLLAMFLTAAHLSGIKPASLREWVRRSLLIVTLVVFWTFPVYFLCVAWHCLYLMCPVLAIFTFTAALDARSAEDQKQVEVEYVTA